MLNTVARRVFVSFRYADGHRYKERLEDLFDSTTKIINHSESDDRRGYAEDTIRKHLYKKLANTSVTIVLLTPEALTYRTDVFGHIDDWTYDEVRYSLEDREGSRTNGLVAVYAPEVESEILSSHSCARCGRGCKVTSVPNRDHLFRRNMMNVKSNYKKHQCDGIFDSNEDSYCSLVSWSDFCNNYADYIDRAARKRERIDEFYICKKLE